MTRSTETPRREPRRGARLLFRLGVVACTISALGAADAGSPKRILFFTKSQRSEHSVIRRVGDRPSFAENILGELATKHHWEVETSKDGRIFTAENLRRFDLLFFYSNGTLTEPGLDRSPPMTEEGKAALIEAVRDGKPFVAVHTALTTFNRNPLGKIDPYIAMLGGEGITHNAQQKARNIRADPKFPGFADLSGGLELFEEWYASKNFAPDLHVILVQETKGMSGPLYQRAPYPATWARMHGKGRVFVTSLGHREDVWGNPVFQRILVGGISWGLGLVDADITPNLESVAPRHAEVAPEK